jgi:hypothetical protein
MGRNRLLVVFASVAVGISQVNVATTDASPPELGYHSIRVWMLNPVDVWGQKACLTQRWHEDEPTDFDPLKALDWKAGNNADTNCTFDATEVVKFRTLAADLSQAYDGTSWTPLYGVRSNLPPNECTGPNAHLGKMKIKDIFGNSHGYMIYAHTVLWSGDDIDIRATFGATRSNAYVTPINVGDTVQDHPGGCSNGWHVHEVNNDGGDWDSWNSKWDTAATFQNLYVNNDDANWTRRMTATVLVGE